MAVVSASCLAYRAICMAAGGKRALTSRSVTFAGNQKAGVHTKLPLQFTLAASRKMSLVSWHTSTMTPTRVRLHRHVGEVHVSISWWEQQALQVQRDKCSVLQHRGLS